MGKFRISNVVNVLTLSALSRGEEVSIHRTENALANAHSNDEFDIWKRMAEIAKKAMKELG